MIIILMNHLKVLKIYEILNEEGRNILDKSKDEENINNKYKIISNRKIEFNEINDKNNILLKLVYNEDKIGNII